MMTCRSRPSAISDQPSAPLAPEERSRLLRLLRERTIPRTDGSGCLDWMGGTKSNSELYGAIWFRGRSDRVHRVMIMIKGGAYPPRELVVRHLCGNARCVNPDHLAMGTSAENRLDTVLMGRANSHKRLEPHDERRIKQLFRKGRSSWQIAEQLHMACSTVKGFLRRMGLRRDHNPMTEER